MNKWLVFPLENKSGSILILFVMLLFAIFGVLSLVVDMGFSRLTQAQMQSATDSGTIVGLRESGDGSLTLAEQRVNIATHVRSLFDDNSVGASVDYTSDPLQLGAGPNVVMTTGFSGLENLIDADQVETTPVYKPVLETNLNNFQHGDMVLGDFGVPGACDPNLRNHEDSTYCRDDFSPNQAGDAFLMRMRRTDDLLGLDNEVGVSTNGGSLPYLFAKASNRAGALLQGGGVTVRATSIAISSPVLRAGVTTGSIRGISAFVLSESFWNGFLIPDGADFIASEYAVKPEGTIHSEYTVEPDGTINVENGAQVLGGFVFQSHNDLVPLTIGQEIQILGPEEGTLDSLTNGVYVPIYADIGGRDLLVGFGRAFMEWVSGDFLNGAALVRLTKFRGGKVHQNASGILRGFPDNVTSAELNQVLTRTDEINERILIPVLAR